MNAQKFYSNKTSDIIKINFFYKSNKAVMKIISLQDINENINLTKEIITKLKELGIQWICLKLNKKPIVSDNTLWFDDEETSNTCCHIEDFESFYLQNLLSFININNIHIPKEKKMKKGWTLIVDKRKEKQTKLNKIKSDIKKLLNN